MSRLIQDLRPEVAEKAVALVAECEKQGIPVFIYQTYRSYEEQDALYAQGRTKPGRKVTNARGGQSAHNFRRAFDLVPLGADSKPDWNASHETWEKIGAIGKSLGLEWGGDWKSILDRPHFQFMGGLTMTEARNQFETVVTDPELGK